jgi:hypothetical protein
MQVLFTWQGGYYHYGSGCGTCLQEHTIQFFEDLVPYMKFSVRVSKADISRLDAILNAIPEAEIAELQRGLIKYHR